MGFRPPGPRLVRHGGAGGGAGGPPPARHLIAAVNAKLASRGCSPAWRIPLSPSRARWRWSRWGGATVVLTAFAISFGAVMMAIAIAVGTHRP